MKCSIPIHAVLALILALPLGYAATKDDWRGKGIYQLITDRFAPPTPNAYCNPQDRVYCGGTWATVESQLDYVQSLGFDAIWISPAAKNIEGQTVYGEAYHGYWTVDPTQLNQHFGSADDLKALSSACHSRGMYLMVDIAINALASTQYVMTDAALATDGGGDLLFKKAGDYHPSCSINWGNHTSEQQCWLAQSGVALMDLNQGVNEVSQGLINSIKSFCQEYSVDGLRIDASKHMPVGFNHDLCDSAGVFCIGEVAGTDIGYAGSYQGPQAMDSVFSFGLMYACVNTFTHGYDFGSLQYAMSTSAKSYYDSTLVGSFIDSQDLPRLFSLTTDKTLAYSAIVFTFMQGGIPIIYYGTEQEISFGSADPDNRNALWQYNNFATSSGAYSLIKKLNTIRKNLGPSFTGSIATVKAVQTSSIAIQRAGTLTVLTNKGSSYSGTWKIASAFSANQQVIDLLSCKAVYADSSGALTVTWTSGQAWVYVNTTLALKAGVCSLGGTETVS
ncbi:putative alpha-amylase AmyA [Naematelia encephala]|uniref:alpha-amylase n=1 Tax=Naematelia encephala TaxID=71784 RepID=A0A1Y2B7M3_9TREE|nr:putative alpha-amylase AmyA [Naematelia encephala]